MLSVEKIDTKDKKQVRRFIKIPFKFYTDTPQWVPPIIMDVETMLNKSKHPFYEHSDGDFYIAIRDGEDVGRIGVFENTRFNNYHDCKQAQFYFFESEDNPETASELFDQAIKWARGRGLDAMVGPKGLGPLDGYGVIVKGFEHRQMMTMMTYNHPYISRMMEDMGFEKEVDFVSCYIGSEDFKLDKRVHRIADRVIKRGTLRVLRFKNKRDLISWAPKIGQAYNKAFVNNWEYYPLTENEIDFIIDNIITIANPKLFKIIAHGDDVVGFLFAFPDVSAAIQRSKGRLLPFGIIDILIEMKRTDWVALNGVGILPEFQGRGGNALLYTEVEKTVNDFKFKHADLVQVAETAVEMRSDLINVGGKPFKNHRVYRKAI